MAVILRKRPLFHKRYYYLELIENRYKGDEYKWVRTMIMLGEDMLHYIAGYLYREKKLRTKDEVVKYFLDAYTRNVSGYGFVEDIEFRRDAKYLKEIIEVFD